MRTTTTESGFYGDDHDLYYVTETGRVWHVQSDDRDDLPRECDSLRMDVAPIDADLCRDVDVTGCED